MPTDAHIFGPGLLPTPFTAAEIREATGSGIIVRLFVESPDGSQHERFHRFDETDADGATLHAWFAENPDDVVTSRVTWAELQEHAAFPADHTRVTTEVIDIPLGRIECARYDTSDGPDAPVETYWFSPGHPGMPVRYEVPLDHGVLRTTVMSILPV